MRIAIVEDDKNEQNKVQSMLEQYAASHDLHFEYFVFDNAESFLAEMPDVNLLLLDIQMGGMSGMDAAKLLRERGNGTPILFVSSMVQFSVEGYSVDALDFIAKPYTQEVFELKMNHAMRKIRFYEEMKEPSPLVIKNNGQISAVKVKDILYVEAYKHQTRIHTEQSVIDCSGTLQEMEEQLPKNLFFRCHVAILVNLSHVRKIDGSEAIVDEEKVPVSRHRKKAFSEALICYMGRVA